MQCIIVDSGKGGVGKTFITKALAEYFLTRNKPFACFECDRVNPDVSRSLSPIIPVQLAVFSEAERLEDAANSIYLSARNKRTLVNLPAQAPIQRWFEANDILAIAADDDVQFIFLFVVTNGYDSLELLRRHLEYFQDQVQHIVVKNHGIAGDDWEAFEADDLQELLTRYQAKVIDFPRFSGSATRNRLDQNSLSFGAGLAAPDFNSLEKQRIRKFLKAAFAAFETTEVL